MSVALRMCSTRGAAIAVVALACVELAFALAGSARDEAVLRGAADALRRGDPAAVLGAAPSLERLPDGRGAAALAYAYAALRRDRDAVRQFTLALRHDPQNWVLQRDGAVASLRIGQRGTARRRILRALALNPRIQIAHSFATAIAPG